MDLAPPRPYVGRRMHVLLLLTALLGALTGLGSEARGGESRLARAEGQVVAIAAAQVAPTASSYRPVAEAPVPLRVAPPTPVGAFPPARPAPLATVKLLE